MKQEIRVYDDWSGGHWGNIGPFKAPDNMYRSVNLQRYANGTLGPRPGWKKLATTGTAPSPTASGSLEPFYGMRWSPGETDGGYLLFVSRSDTTASRRLDMDTLEWKSTNLGSIPQPMQLSAPGAGNIFSHMRDRFIVGASKFYDPVSDSNIVTISWPSSFAPKGAAVYKARMYGWGDDTYPGRVYYSVAGDYTFYTATDFFDVGHPTFNYIVGMWDFRDSLLILTLQGNIADRQSFAEWWSLQGANPITGSLRRLQRAEWPYVPEFAVPYRDSLLWMDVLYDHGINIHNGSDIDTLALSRLTGRPGGDTSGSSVRLMKPAYTYGESSIVIPHRVGTVGSDPTGREFENGLLAWELVNGTWTKASYWNGAKEEVVDNDVPFLWAVTDWGGDRLIGCTNTSQDGTGEFEFYSRDIARNRPSTVTDPYSDPLEDHGDIASSGGGLDCQLWLTPVQADEGSGVRVTKVVVDFDYWKNSYFESGDHKTAMKVSIVNFRQNRGWSKESDELIADFSAFEESVDVIPRRGRYVFRFPDSAWYSASQVHFSFLRNVAIDRVSVHFDRNPKEPQ